MAERDKRAGAALVGGGAGLLATAPLVPGRYGAVRGAVLTRQRDRLDAAAQNQRDLPRRARHRPGTPGRATSPRLAAIQAHAAERARLTSRIKAGPGKVGTALAVGQGVLGAGLVGAGVRRYHGRASEVGKAEDFLNSQNFVGIPPWRTNPVDPLAMKASSSIMADILVGASGRNLSRRQKKRIRQGAYRFVGAQHLVVTPTGMRGLVTE